MARNGKGAVKFVRAFLVSAGLGLAVSACLGQTCTLIACSNAVYVNLTRDGAWPDGAYTLELSFDEELRACEFSVPADLPPGGRLAALDCGAEGVEALLRQRSTCTSTVSNDGNSGSGSCTPIPDQYELSLEIIGNPTSVGVTLSRDGKILLDDTRKPKYEHDYPNGSDCDEGCTQAGYSLKFED